MNKAKLSASIQRLRSLADKKRNLRKGIYILPSLFTLGSTLLSFTAIISVVRLQTLQPEDFIWVGALIALATLLDVLDGIVARLTKTQSDFGMQLDSLADAISFGVAPAVILYAWAFHLLGPKGYLLPFIFLMTGIIRLARFNVVTYTTDRRFFIGLPIPAGAMLLLLHMIMWPGLPHSTVGLAFVVVLTIVTSYLMVSPVRFRTFKEIQWGRRVPVRVALTLLLMLLLPLWNWKIALYIMALCYVGSGVFQRFLPANWDWRRVGLDPKSLDGVMEEAIGLDLDEAEPDDELDEPSSEPGDEDASEDDTP
jgi:CDP-diacylglycerol---serine O-phosphatidyltransferase